jgi:CRP-like cAMP-binding protein
MVAKINTTYLDDFSLFDCLSNDEKARLGSSMEYLSRPKYHSIYQEGDAATAVYFLQKGTVKISKHNQEGKEVIKRLIYPKSMFGELSLIGETHRKDFAQALKEGVQVYAIPVLELKALMQENFDLCTLVMNTLGNRLLKAETKLEAVIFKDARARIIEFIKDAIEQRGRRVGYEMLLKHSLTHQDIASVTCTSRQTVTLVLNELRKSDLIYFNRGRILVRDINKLA